MPNDLDGAFANLANALINNAKMTHAFAVLRSAAILDYDLERSTAIAMKPLSGGKRKKLLKRYGPIGTFDGKINLAHKLGIITADIQQELHLIRKNDLARTLNSKSPGSAIRGGRFANGYVTVLFPKPMCWYSILADQFGVNAYSTPAPMV
jgi:hypothetical protein